MSQLDFNPPEDQKHGETPSDVLDEVPGFLSRIMHIASGLARHLRENPVLRAEVIQILRHFEAAITPSEPSEASSTPAEATQDTESSEEISDQVPGPAPAQEPERELIPEAPPVAVDASTVRDLESGIASVNAFGTAEAIRPTRTAVGLDGIARSCRVKAKACVWTVERKKLIADGVDFRMEVAPRDRALFEKARALEDCFLWMLTRTAPMPEPLELYSELADRYEDAADAADLLAELVQQDDEREMLEAAMSLGAEAQAALREAVSSIGFQGDEPSQTSVFYWLRQTALERDVFIPRFMRMADKPGQSDITSLSRRITDLQQRHRTHISAKKATVSALKTLRYHLGQMSPGRDNTHDWNRIFATISEVVPKYLRSNDVRLRELLIKHIDQIPEQTVVPQAGQDVLEAVDRFVASSPEADLAEQTQVVLSSETNALRKNLKGKTMVVIGGEARPYAKEALREAFDLRDVVWISTREHESPETFKPYIRAPEVAVVLLAIRWSSHCYGAVRDYCRDANVPFVRLPAGYNPSQVTHQVIEQIPILAIAEPLSTGQK